MPAPDKTFTVIPDSDVDPDSPVTTGLMTGLRDNDQHLEQWLGDSFTAAKDHDHDGVNSKIVALSGASINRGHHWEIFDHFTSTVIDTDIWTVGGTPTITANQHYVEMVAAADEIKSKLSWRIDQARVILEMRARLTITTTDWQAIIGAFDPASPTARSAQFRDATAADDIRCRTIGSGGGGTQDTDVAVGGGGVDAWHVYKIDLTSTTQTKFYIDGTLVATHSTTVPDAVDLNVAADRSAGTTNLRLDYVKAYFTNEISDSTA